MKAKYNNDQAINPYKDHLVREETDFYYNGAHAFPMMESSGPGIKKGN